jgi:hypothetical protein
MKRKYLIPKIIISFFSLLMWTAGQAGTPLWTFIPLTPTTISVPSNTSATIKYQVTNQSNKPHTLAMIPIQGIAQINIGENVCSNPFVLPRKGSFCILSLQANGSQLPQVINDGPVICENGSTNQCYRPSAANILNIGKAPPITLPAGCVETENNNIQCTIPPNYGFTNMPYALCRSAQCDYDGIQTSVTCSCQLIRSYQGVYSASVSPSDYNTSKPIGNTVTSTYSMVNSSGETPTNCSSGPFANCFGASCTVNGNSVTCTCPVATSTYIAPESNCTLTNKIWSATSVSSFPAIEGAMLYMYNTFFGGNTPS